MATDQKPSPSGVCSVGSCHHTGASRAVPLEQVVREAVGEVVEVGEVDALHGHGWEPTGVPSCRSTHERKRRSRILVAMSAATVRSSTDTRARTVSPARMEKYRAERDAIMRAAYELIQRNGSKETSVHDVLRETGYSTRAFYRHFRSKDELVIEMYRVDSDRVSEALAAAVAAAATPLDGLEAWIDQSLAVVYDARRLRHAVVLSSPEVASADGLLGGAAGRTRRRNVHRSWRSCATARRTARSRSPNPRPTRSRSRPSSARTCVPGLLHAGGLTRAEARAHTVALFRRALGA